jgi:hypothetical protein
MIAYLYFVGRQHLKYEYPDAVIWFTAIERGLNYLAANGVTLWRCLIGFSTLLIGCHLSCFAI